MNISSEQFDLIESYTDQFPENTQLSIAILNGDDVNFFGFIKSKDTLFSIDNSDSVFEIGSITKVFTSTLLSQLILTDSVKVDDPIENILSFPLHPSDYDNSKISLKTLSNHTSGLPNFPADYQTFSKYINGYDTTELNDYLKNEISLISAPEEMYNYSNLGYAILGHLIELIQEENYENLLQNWICKRYNLESTTTDLKKIKNMIVPGRDSLGNIIENSDWGYFAPSGGILSNVIDLSRFVQANFTNDSLLVYQRRETYSWGNFGMALGWEIWKTGNDCNWYSKGGGMDGYRSNCAMDVSSKCAVIILSNLSNQHPKTDNIDKLANGLLKLEYVKVHQNDSLANAFIEIALKNGWGKHRRDSLIKMVAPKNSIIGVWKQIGNNRINTKTFFSDGKFQSDFFKDSEIDVWGYYEINTDSIVLNDFGGAACPSKAFYQFELINDTLHFIPILDKCDGRVNGFSGTWTRMK